jgi:3-methyladenine DNA glycosylase Tag
MASLKNLEAALLQLQGKALEHYGAIEILINNPTAISEHTDYVGEIIRHAKALSECEEAYGSLQKHFVPKVQPPSPVQINEQQPATREVPPEGSITIDDKNSATMKRALKRTTSRKKREAKKDDE